MNRSLKFRAWYAGGLDKMVYFGEPIVSNTELEKGETWGMLFPIIQGKAYIAGSIPMQFTGLKDKNDKEIYEGDIIRIFLRRHMEDSAFANAEIRFEGAAFWFNAPKIGFTDCNWHFYNQSDMEVIGNIYENPEFLK